jgi:hypothetical protein
MYMTDPAVPFLSLSPSKPGVEGDVPAVRVCLATLTDEEGHAASVPITVSFDAFCQSVVQALASTPITVRQDCCMCLGCSCEWVLRSRI